MTASHGAAPSPFKQPRAVWAVAFACVVSFMGIGLVDPILPALAGSLHATPSQVSLLFTSYLVVTAVAMLVVGWVSSRIGAKRTLVVGLIVIVVFAALAGTSNSIGGIVGFRAGWGLGNALFIATSLAVIVASASGGFAGAIILYETALGLGIAVGPLLGGELGSISWRWPFFGVAVLMFIALVATLAFVPTLPKPEHKTSLAAPLKALRHRGLLTIGIMALLYNWGFFTMLGYAPYPMELDAQQLGLVFTGWGLLVAAFSVFFAPRLQARFGTAPVLYVNLLGLGIVMAVIAAGVHTPIAVIVAVIVSGAFIGINNTLTTQAVMLVSPVERPVASSAYGFIRFIGGGLAPLVAGKLADATDLSVPFYLGGVAFILAIVVLASGHKLVAATEKGMVEGETVRPSLQRVGATPTAGYQPVIVAVSATEDAAKIVDAAAAIARDVDTTLEVVHVRETAVVEELAIEAEGAEQAHGAVLAHLDRLAAQNIAATGQVLTSVGDHAAAGRVLAQHAADVGARIVALGRSPRGPVAQFGDGSFTAALTHAAACTVVLVEPDKAPHRLLTASSLHELVAGDRSVLAASAESEAPAPVAAMAAAAAVAMGERPGGRHALAAYEPVGNATGNGVGSAMANGTGTGNGHGTQQIPAAAFAAATPIPDGPGSGPAVVGSVVRGNGAGLGQVVVTVADLTGRHEARTTTGPDGDYRVLLRTGGTYLVVAAAGPYQPHAALVAVADGPARHDIVLAGTSGVVGAVLVTDRSGTAHGVAGATVTLIDVRGDAAAAGVTDAAGRYHLTGVPDGGYTLTAASAGHQPVAVSVRLGLGTTVERDLELPHRSRLIGTVVAASDGHLVAEAMATLVDQTGTVVGSTVTGPDGTFVFEDLPEGTYTLTASGYAPVAQVVHVAAGGQTTTPMELGTRTAAPSQAPVPIPDPAQPPVADGGVR